MMKLISRAALTAFIYANANIFLRIAIFISSFFCINLFYTKWEKLLLTSYPDTLFYLLSLYTLIIAILLIWVILSFPFFSSFAKSKKTLEVKKSFQDRSHEYNKIRDVKLHPKLKSSSEKSLESS